MLLILEGVNATGKTTLARALKSTGMAYFKDNGEHIKTEGIERRRDTETATIAQASVLATLSNKIDIVVDRFYMTELVYGFFERNMPIKCSFMEDVESILSKTDVLTIYTERNTTQGNALDVTYKKLLEKSSIANVRVDISSVKSMKALSLLLKKPIIEHLQFDEKKVVI